MIHAFLKFLYELLVRFFYEQFCILLQAAKTFVKSFSIYCRNTDKLKRSAWLNVPYQYYKNFNHAFIDFKFLSLQSENFKMKIHTSYYNALSSAAILKNTQIHHVLTFSSFFPHILHMKDFLENHYTLCHALLYRGDRGNAATRGYAATPSSLKTNGSLR